MSAVSRQATYENEFVLIVDDDDLAAGMLERVLAREGCRAKRVRDGKEALEMLQRDGVVPSVILLDLMMPRMGGLELIERLERDDSFRQIPVILMSGHPSLARSPKIRVLDYLPKPFDAAELMTLIRAVSQRSCSRWTAAAAATIDRVRAADRS